MLRGIIFVAVALILIDGGGGYWITRAEAAIEKRAGLGAYDPNKVFQPNTGISVTHVFIAWQAFDANNLRSWVDYATKRGRRMFVTVEPFTKAPNWTDGGDHLFADILDGKFNGEIKNVCREVKRMPGKPIIRWGQEMENVTGRYPWARTDANGYVAAYRYFVKRCNKFAPNARYVWSPIGHDELTDYYPGKKYVNYIGLPIWGYEKADKLWYGKSRTFEEAVKEKYDRIASFKKPVIIAEFGVSGSKSYEQSWLEDAGDVRQTYRRIKKIVYFNMKEPVVWPDDLGEPDWRIPAKTWGYWPSYIPNR